MGETMALVQSTAETGLIHLRLNNPAAGNVLSVAAVDALTDAITQIDATLARAILISAEGPNFCVGGDLRGIGAADDRAGTVRRMADSLHDGLRALEKLAIPVVVAVNGNAAGAGLSLALAGDIILGGQSSAYMMAYTGIGLSADGGASFRLPRLVGLRLTQEMAYLGRRLDAAEALEAGLLTRVVPDEALLEDALVLARQLAAGPTGAYRRMKQLIDVSYRSDFAYHLDAETDDIVAAVAGHDGGEGIRAFLERRSPAFRGD